VLVSPNHRQHAFSVVELMIAIALVGILSMLSMPMYRTWQQNSQLRASAESILAGLQHARTEAVRLNETTGVQFVVTGNAWHVERVAAPGVILHQGGGDDLAQNASVTPLPANAPVKFTPLGAVDPAGFTIDFNVRHADEGGADPTLKCVADGGEMRCLSVQVRGGGLVRLCDPSVTAAGDPRRCMP
jgi:type IV fimbrial biogenesis protein FimT